MTKKGMDGVKLQVILPKSLVEDFQVWADKIGMPLGTLLRTILIWAKNSRMFPLMPDTSIEKYRPIDLNEFRTGGE